MMVCRCIDVSAASKHVNLNINRPGRRATASHRRCLQTDLILNEHKHVDILYEEMSLKSL